MRKVALSSVGCQHPTQVFGKSMLIEKKRKTMDAEMVKLLSVWFIYVHTRAHILIIGHSTIEPSFRELFVRNNLSSREEFSLNDMCTSNWGKERRTEKDQFFRKETAKEETGGVAKLPTSVKRLVTSRRWEKNQFAWSEGGANWFALGGEKIEKKEEVERERGVSVILIITDKKQQAREREKRHRPTRQVKEGESRENWK